MNTESSKLDRLRVLIGAILAVAGVITIIIVGAFYGYSNVIVWLVGVGLIVLGLVIARESTKLIIFLADLLRF